MTLALTLNLSMSSGLVWISDTEGPQLGQKVILFPRFRLPPPFESHAAWWYPPRTPSPTEEKERNKQSTCTAEDALLWDVGLGIRDHLRLMDGSGD